MNQPEVVVVKVGTQLVTTCDVCRSLVAEIEGILTNTAKQVILVSSGATPTGKERTNYAHLRMDSQRKRHMQQLASLY